MGADSICIKDMAGLLSPYNAEKLVRTLKSQLTVPIDIHTHFTSGTGRYDLFESYRMPASI